MNDSFILFTSYYAIIEGLTDEQLGQLMRALFLYARDGKTIGLDPVVAMAFAFIKDDLDRNADKYQKKCEKLRANIRKRWNAKNTNEYNCIQMNAKNTNEYNCIQMNAKNTNEYNCSLYDNDNDNDNEYDNDVTNVTDSINNNPLTSKRKCNTEVLHPEKSLLGEEIKKEKKGKGNEATCAAILNYWNEQHDKTSSSMRRIALMTDKRKMLIRARLRQVGGKTEILYRVIDAAMASDFLNGNNSRGWTANFDWIFGNGNNFAKVLDGYDDNPAREPMGRKTAAEGQQPTQAVEPTVGELYRQAQQPTRGKEDKDKELRERYLGMVEVVRENPKTLCRGALVSAYEAGELQRLGIEWRPE